MNHSSPQLAGALNPGNCVSYRLRRAARLAAKVFDAALKPMGLRNTQFTLLATLADRGAMNIGALAELLATDGTTLTRNLEVLVRRNLVEDVVTEDARVRMVQLSDQGCAKYQEALPLWVTAQQQVLEGLSPERWTEMVDELHQIEVACDRTK